MKIKNGKTARPKFHIIMPIDKETDANAYKTMKEKVFIKLVKNLPLSRNWIVRYLGLLLIRFWYNRLRKFMEREYKKFKIINNFIGDISK